MYSSHGHQRHGGLAWLHTAVTGHTAGQGSRTWADSAGRRFGLSNGLTGQLEGCTHQQVCLGCEWRMVGDGWPGWQAAGLGWPLSRGPGLCHWFGW